MMKFYMFLLVTLVLAACNGTSSGDSRFDDSVTDDYESNSNAPSCEECGNDVYYDSDYCEEHTCPECSELKDEYDDYCEEHTCPECGELKYDYDEYCEEHTCPDCGEFKDEYDDYCEEHTCPRCRYNNYSSKKYSWDEYCYDCTDEVENTCSRCGGHEYYIYGGLCSSCEDEDDW